MYKLGIYFLLTGVNFMSPLVSGWWTCLKPMNHCPMLTLSFPMNSTLPTELRPLMLGNVSRRLYITFSWLPSLPPWFSLPISHPVSLLALRLLMSYSGLAPGIGAPEQRQSHSEVISEEGETINQIRSDVSCLHWCGASIEAASGIFLANAHLPKALTSGAQALLLNHSLSGSCPSAQVWAPAGGTLSTGFRAVWEQG